MRFLKNLAIVAFLIFCFDGCMYRDPYVSLGNGYSIIACSPSSPCGLFYSSSDDDRVYSDYMASEWLNPATNEPEYLLEGGADLLIFTDEDKWREAIHEYNAFPYPSLLHLDNVTSFAADDGYIIGEYDGGYYIVDMGDNRLYPYTDADSWRSAVAGWTTLSTKKLTDPKSFFLQTRDPPVLAIYALLVAVAIGFGFRKRKIRIAYP